MKIGFMYMWKLGSTQVGSPQFIGDEAYGRALREELLNLPGVDYCELLNQEPQKKLDIMVYWNDNHINKKYAHKSILYFQNGYSCGSDKKLAELKNNHYDGYMFMSQKLLEHHRLQKGDGIYLSSAANTNLMKPRKPVIKYSYDVAYMGNDIKGWYRTMKYIYPATKYNFGLYGNWNNKFWFLYHYRRVFHRISKGRLPQEDTSSLYSSAKIILNCTIKDQVKWDTLTARVYEVLSCNGFLITDFLPNTEKEIAKCVVVTKGGKDLQNTIQYYLDHPQERKKISNNGRKIILAKHTMKHRAQAMLTYFEKCLKTNNTF